MFKQWISPFLFRSLDNDQNLIGIANPSSARLASRAATDNAQCNSFGVGGIIAAVLGIALLAVLSVTALLPAVLVGGMLFLPVLLPVLLVLLPFFATNGDKEVSSK